MSAIERKDPEADAFTVTIEGKVAARYDGKRDVTTCTYTEAQLRGLYTLLQVTFR